MTNPFNFLSGQKALPIAYQNAADYYVDFWQRQLCSGYFTRAQQHILQAQVSRLSKRAQFRSGIGTGRFNLARLVNHFLMRIKPLEGIVLDERSRPFVVVDPRAGHGRA